MSFTLPKPGARCDEKKLPRSAFDSRSFRWIKRGKKRKVYIMVGCPVGKWAARRERCKVGMKAHVVVRRRTKGGGCAVGRRA